MIKINDMLLGVYVTLAALSAAAKLLYRDDSVSIDPVSKELMIRCKSEGIAKENFKIFHRLENRKMYLYIKGAQVLDDTGLIKTVRRKYLLKNIGVDDMKNLSYRINERNELLVTIPLSVVDKKTKVKYQEQKQL